MLNAIRQFFSPPVFPHDEAKTRLSKILYVLVTSLLAVIALGLIATLLIFVEKGITTSILLISLGILLTIDILVKRGHLLLGSILYIIMLWSAATITLYLGNGTSGSQLGFYLALTVTAGILLSVRWAVALAIINALAILFIALLEINGYPFPHLFPEPPLTRWFNFSVTLLLTITPVYLILTSLSEALTRVQQENKQRKEVERLLRESETRLRNISDNLPGGMTYQLDMGLNGEMRQFTYVSAGVEKLHEVTGEAVLQDAQILYGQIFEQDLPFFTAQEAQAQAAMSTFRAEARFRLPSGAIRWCLLTSAPRRAPNGHLVWDGIEIDITERKQVEQTLIDEATRRRILIEQSRDGIVILDQDGHVYESNQKFADMLGYPLEEMRKLSVFDWEFLFPRERVLEMIRTVDEMGDHFETKHRRRDGSVYDVEISTNAALFAGQKLIFCVNRDITERKKAEEQVKKALDEKIALLQELYHRTKNNMQVIIALLDWQAEYIQDTQVRNILRETQHRIHSMALVHQKLYQSRDLSHINLQEYIYDLANRLIQSYQIAPGQVDLVLAMEDVFVLIDTAIPCGLIVNELISNALKYAFPQGRSGMIEIRLQRTAGEEIVLSVADDGVGMPPDFDARTGGQLGLRTVIALAEGQLQGRVSFAWDKGAACTLYFTDDLYTPFDLPIPDSRASGD